LPGTSRHHWGSELDIFDASALAAHESLQLTVEETLPGGPFFLMYQWLDEWLPTQDTFYRPYVGHQGDIAAEPWHLSYRRVSMTFAEQFNRAHLNAVIEASDIELKVSILSHLDDIIDRYVIV
jgi:hypothetical protein